MIGDKLKSVLLDHKMVLLVESIKVDGTSMWQPCSGPALKQY